MNFVPLVQQLIEDGYERIIVDLREPLYATCKILGLELEQLEEWKKEFREKELKRQQQMEFLKAPRILPDTVNNSRNTGKQTVTRKKVKKIGRNEPCPCGSGKKYKKCCGR